MSDNALNYRRSDDFQAVLADLGARHVLIRPHCPWTNGKVERLNRTLLREWAYSRVFDSNAERAACLPEWLEHYNTRRRHSSLGAFLRSAACQQRGERLHLGPRRRGQVHSRPDS